MTEPTPTNKQTDLKCDSPIKKLSTEDLSGQQLPSTEIVNSGSDQNMDLIRSDNLNSREGVPHNCSREYWRGVKARVLACLSAPSIRWGCVLSTVLCLALGIFVICYPALLHNPKHFAVSSSDAVQDSEFNFHYAILANNVRAGGQDHLYETGKYSNSDKKSDGEEVRIYTSAVIHTIKTPPLFKESLLPPNQAIVEALSQTRNDFSPTSDRLFAHIQIEHPSNGVVDLSTLNSCFFALPLDFFKYNTYIGTVYFSSGDYVTNQLTLRTHVGTDANSAGKVRIFVQDESGVPKGITLERTRIFAKPENFQIWYSGDGPIRIKGPSVVNCVIYAPHADVEIGPDVEFRGAIVCKSADIVGGTILYDEDLSAIKDWR